MTYQDKLKDLLNEEVNNLKIINDLFKDPRMVECCEFRCNFLQKLIKIKDLDREKIISTILLYSDLKLKYMTLCNHYSVIPSEVMISNFNFAIESLDKIK